MSRARDAIAQEAARIVCEELITDYGQAKRKAAERLGSGSRDMPDNAQIQLAVIEYQRLFGGEEYRQHLQRMRQTALKAMKLLDPFQPRLVGAAVSGAVTTAHRVQLHVFCDKAEALDIYLQDHGVRFDQGEREYRYPGGTSQRIALSRFEADGVGVDIAAFGEDQLRRLPLNPADGQAFKRLDAAAVAALVE